MIKYTNYNTKMKILLSDFFYLYINKTAARQVKMIMEKRNERQNGR